MFQLLFLQGGKRQYSFYTAHNIPSLSYRPKVCASRKKKKRAYDIGFIGATVPGDIRGKSVFQTDALAARHKCLTE